MSNLIEKYNLKVKKIEHHDKFDFFLKKIVNKKGLIKKVLDFEKIFNLPHKYVLIVSSRGNLGKTYNSKEILYERWKRKGRVNYHLRNLTKDLQIEKVKYLSQDCPPNVKENCYIKGSAKNNNLAVYDKSTDKMFVRFQSLNAAEDEKGSRVIPDIVIFDEFNVNSKLVQDYIYKLDSFLHSTEDIVNDYGWGSETQVIFFGNNKSLNHPLLYSLGISTITSPCTEIVVNDVPLMYILWEFTNDNYRYTFIDDNKKNATFLFSLLLGTAEHSYFNDVAFDEINYVEPILTNWNDIYPDININLCIDLKYTIYHKGKYLNIYHLKNYDSKLETKWHIAIVDKKYAVKNKLGKNMIFSLNARDRVEGVIPAPSSAGKKHLSRLLGLNLVSFETIVARDIFISALQ